MTKMNMALLFNAIHEQARLLERSWRSDTGLADLSPYFMAIEALSQSGFDACSKLSPPRRKKATLTVVG
jgi:hypothetical protein